MILDKNNLKTAIMQLHNALDHSRLGLEKAGKQILCKQNNPVAHLHQSILQG